MSRKWTNGELIDELLKHPREARVFLEDADTSWTVPEFDVSMHETDNQVWIYPCGYDKIGKGD